MKHLDQSAHPRINSQKKPAHALLHKNLILIKGTPRRKLADPGPTH